MLVALTKFLASYESCKIITFSHINSTNFNDNFKDNFMQEKVNKRASKAKTRNICTLEPNWKWIRDDLILTRKKLFSRCNSKFQSKLIVLILSFASFAFFSPPIRLEAFSSCFLMTFLISLSVTPLVYNAASKLKQRDRSQK